MKLSISTSFVTLAALLCAVSESVSGRALSQTRDSTSTDSTNTTTTINDDTILNFALTLEHLENAFYSGALSTFTQEDFLNSGLPVWARGRFEEIAEHEKTHVEFLTAALGENATEPCNYSFPYTSPTSFAALSSALEGVGVSAYAGAAQFLSDKGHLTAAAAILATEARQAAWVNSAIIHQNPWSTSFDTPLSLDVVFTLAAQFITSCPESNPVLPVRAFPALTITSPYKGGETSAVNVNATGVDVDGQFVAFFTGLDTIFAPVVNGEVVIPEELIGTSYAVLTNSDMSADDSSIIAGVAIIDIPF